MKKFINDLTLSGTHPKLIDWCSKAFPDDTSFDLMLEQVLPHLDRIDRGAVKTSTMTCLSYGASMITAFTDIREQLKTVFLVVDKPAQDFILRMLFYSMEGAYSAPVTYQTFSKKLFVYQSRRDDSTSWTTPLTGLPITLRVTKEDEHKVAYFDIRSRKIHKAVLRRKTNDTNYRKMGSTSCPSFIHSIDAAILTKTAEKVCGNFMPLHDAFGVLCNDIEDLKNITNEVMYDLSQQDCLNKLKEEVAPELDLEVPYVGDWNPKEVLTATHAFT